MKRLHHVSIIHKYHSLTLPVSGILLENLAKIGFANNLIMCSTCSVRKDMIVYHGSSEVRHMVVVFVYLTLASYGASPAILSTYIKYWLYTGNPLVKLAALYSPSKTKTKSYHICIAPVIVMLVLIET